MINFPARRASFSVWCAVLTEMKALWISWICVVASSSPTWLRSRTSFYVASWAGISASSLNMCDSSQFLVLHLVVGGEFGGCQGISGEFWGSQGLRGEREIRCQETQTQVKMGHAAFATLYSSYATTIIVTFFGVCDFGVCRNIPDNSPPRKPNEANSDLGLLEANGVHFENVSCGKHS